MSDDTPATCLVCNSPHGFQWTDTHGVGVCHRCGAPYTVFHYAASESGNKRVDKAPEIALNPEGVVLARRYWAETQRMVYPAAYDMGFLSGRSTTYSGATQDDLNAFEEWHDRQPEVITARTAIKAATSNNGETHHG